MSTLLEVDCAQWSDIMCSDLSKFVLNFLDGRLRVWCQTGQLYQPPVMVAHVRYGGESVMVWGCLLYTSDAADE